MLPCLCQTVVSPPPTPVPSSPTCLMSHAHDPYPTGECFQPLLPAPSLQNNKKGRGTFATAPRINRILHAAAAEETAIHSEPCFMQFIKQHLYQLQIQWYFKAKSNLPSLSINQSPTSFHYTLSGIMTGTHIALTMKVF